jgi:imidazolonepropionase-like amidohydrolase
LKLAMPCLALLFGLFAAMATVAAEPDPLPQRLAIERVTVLPMISEAAALSDVTVLIEDGRIVSVTPASSTRAPSGVRRIDGRGKWLIPGLTDMHAHLGNVRMLRLFLKLPDLKQSILRTEDLFTPFIANGVVRILDMQSMSETIGQRVEVDAGRMIGPHIVAAAMIDGPNPYWPIGTTRVAATPDDGRQAVRDAGAEGYDVIKVYSGLSFETFSGIVDEARRLSLPVVGHIPERRLGRTKEFFQPGFGMVAHAEEFAQRHATPSLAEIPQYVDMMKQNGAWLTATLSLDERLLEQTRDPKSLHSRPEIRVLPQLMRDMVLNHNPYVAGASPQRIAFLTQVVEFNRELVRAFVAAGIPVVAGTDAGVPGVVPGFSMHDELEALTRAGMSNRQALEAATRRPCEWLNLLAECGTVEAGKRADLILLDADPLANIGNSRRISAVILGGRYLPRATLDRRIEALAAPVAVR